MHTNDCILLATSGPTVNEGLLAWYQANGATSNDLQDAERQALVALGNTPSDARSMWMEYFDTLLIPAGAFRDRWNYFWCITQAP